MGTLGDKLRYWRLTTGTPVDYILEQLLLADRSTYYNWEYGANQVSEFILECLLIIFGITHDELMSSPGVLTLSHYDRQEIAKRTEQVLDKTGMSVSELAVYLGVDESNIVRWVAGRTVPRLETMAELAVLVDMDIKEFIEKGC
ncbi:helix-turn-helix transcriptional regulator [Dolosigranulum savutiense]|uniref:Helix-turn-helix transcriptional regulator n=1 Tax=Dolosigranulum savutiense TaxID=3110288 RepID=A0AB74TLM8_9LACT